MNTQPDFASRLTRSIAGQVRHWRKERGLSAQQLSDLCAALGLEIARNTVADLENGRRQNITAAEVFILAAALDVAPAELLLPVGQASETEILPGRHATTVTALRWLAGKTTMHPDGGWLHPGRPAWNLRDVSAAQLLFQHDAQAAEAREAAGRNFGDTAISIAHLRQAEARLRGVRAEMRHRSMLLPELDADLAYIDAGLG